MHNILLIEDNIQLQKYICEYLTAYEYNPVVLADYDAVIETINEITPKLILLDITLPKFDGFYFLKLIKKHCDVPVIIMTARSEEAEQIRGIEGGAYDYITKPFSVGVLMAKINSLLKKTGDSEGALKVGGLMLLADSMSVEYGALSTELTKNEFRILWLLMKKTGQIVTREQILEELWDDTNFIDNNTLTVNVTRAKKKLQEIGLNNVILTKRGIGYVLDTNGM